MHVQSEEDRLNLLKEHTLSALRRHLFLDTYAPIH